MYTNAKGIKLVKQLFTRKKTADYRKTDPKHLNFKMTIYLSHTHIYIVEYLNNACLETRGCVRKLVGFSVFQPFFSLKNIIIYSDL